MKLKTSTIIQILIYFSFHQMYAEESEDLRQDFNNGFAISIEKSDSAIGHYERIRALAIEQQDTLLNVKSLIQLANINFLTFRNTETLELLTEALYLAEQKNYLSDKSTILNDLATLYYRFGLKKQGYEYTIESFELRKQLYKEGKLEKAKIRNSYRTLASLEKDNQNYDLALNYLDSCFLFFDDPNKIDSKSTFAHLEKARLYITKGEPQKALEILHPLEIYYDSLLSNTEIYTSNTSIQAFVFVLKGKILLELGETDKAYSYYTDALKIHRIHDMHHVSQANILRILAKIEYDNGAYQIAYDQLLEATKINDHYFLTKNNKNSSILSIKDAYREELKNKKDLLITQNLELAEQAKALFRFRAFVVLIILLIVIAIVMTRNRLQKIHFRNKQMLAQQKSEEKQRNAEALLNTKNKELTSYTLQLIERDDLLDRFTEHAKEHDKSTAAKSLIVARKQLNTNNWEEFNQRFVSVNRGFYERLQAKFPELTQTDLKHCALIKLNFTGKEMANLLGISEKSVHMARYRIRKKFAIDTETNLSMYVGRI